MLACSAASAAPAAVCHGISFPQQLSVEGRSLVLNGTGIRQATIFRVNVYVAALYLAQPTRDARTVLRAGTPEELVLHFMRNVSAGDLRAHFLEDFGRNAPQEMPVLRQRIEELNTFLSDVKSGERMIFVRLADGGVRIELNGARRTIPSPAFGRALFSIWLGSSPPSSELKAGLLGAPCE